MTDTAQTTDTPEPGGEWVRLEIFGHRCHYGLLTEIERFGAKLARIDEFRVGEDRPFRTLVYSGGAIFSVLPVTEKTAREQAGFYVPPAVLSLPSSDDEDCDDEQPF